MSSSKHRLADGADYDFGAARKVLGVAAEEDQPLHPALLLPELVDLVFKSLDCHSLCAAGSVCREWRIASQREEYWTKLEFSSSQGQCSRGNSAMASLL